MPLQLPVIDDRRYQQLVDDTLARVPVHTPEWTNFNQSDPGVTLVQLFSFLTENLLYRANLIPERNRTKFLQLLQVPLLSAQAAQGLVSIANERAPLQRQTLPADLEVRAGSLAFRTQLGLDVLPIEARVFFKRPLAAPSNELREYYRLLYASYQVEFPSDISLYETVALDPKVVDSVDLNEQTVDRSLWVALLARRVDVVAGAEDPLKEVRDELGGRTLTLGIVPALDAVSAQLSPGGVSDPGSLLAFELPRVGADGGITRLADGRVAPAYRQLVPRTEVDLLTSPGVVQLSLPAAAELRAWNDLEPLESGVGNLPPALEDTGLADRLITWLRISAPGAAQSRLKWVGINTVPVQQRERINAEPLADGDGTPDQTRQLARAPVLSNSIQVTTRAGDETLQWSETDDLYAAPPEVPVPDPRQPPGVASAEPLDPTAANVFVADAEAGMLKFGDGLRGRRLPLGARVFATYEFCAGAAGNVAEGAINAAPSLPSGFTVSNPVRTWGGADAETVADGEKQVPRFLQHRDRLVSVEDYETIAWRAPGVQIGRIDVLPAFHPDLDPLEPGAAPGVVTVMAIPRFDPGQPDAPRADRLFLNTLCRYLDPRRLVTTELVVRGPVYLPIWISVGIDVQAGFAVAEVVENVKARLREFLAPVGAGTFTTQTTPLFAARAPDAARGWPLRTPVAARVLLAETARVAGVMSVADVLLAEGTAAPAEVIEMSGLQLPWVVGISVVAGEPVPIDALRGDASADGAETPAIALLPVPVIPESC
jgi:hypothetical protein